MARLLAPLPAVNVAGALVVVDAMVVDVIGAEAVPAGIVELPVGKGATIALVVETTDVVAAAEVMGAADVDAAAEVDVVDADEAEVDAAGANVAEHPVAVEPSIFAGPWELMGAKEETWPVVPAHPTMLIQIGVHWSPMAES